MTDQLTAGTFVPATAPEVPDWAPDACGHHREHDLGLAAVPSDRYWSRQFHDLEVARVWSRSWQLACWEDDLPTTGSTQVYDVGPLSFLLVRVGPTEIKAYFNSCLHRGTRLVDGPETLGMIRCPYHAWTWDLDGSLKHIPAEWDFPHLVPAELCLPEARVATWGGMVFLNPDPNAMPLEEYLAPIPEQCARYWPMERRARVAHVAKVFNANWKLTYAAFIETYHVITVHPELGQRIQTGNGRDTPFRSTYQYDYWDHVSRNAYYESESGSTAAAYPTGYPPEYLRVPLAERLGVRPEDLSPEENRGSSVIYHAYPNLQLGAVAFNYVARFRPYGNDPERCLMDIFVTKHLAEGEELPPPTETHFIGPDEPITNAPEILLGGLDPNVYQQDVTTTALQQRGLRAAAPDRQVVVLSQYQETCLRHHDAVLNDYLSRP